MSSIVARAPSIADQALHAITKIASYPENADVRLTPRLTVRPTRSPWHKLIASITCQFFFSYKKYEKDTKIEDVYSSLKKTLLTVLDQPAYATNSKVQAVCQKTMRIFNQSLKTYPEATRIPLDQFQITLDALTEELRLEHCLHPQPQYARLENGTIDYEQLLQPEHSPDASPGSSPKRS